MVSAVEETGMDIESYNQVVSGLQSAQSPEEIGVSDQELQQVQEASDKVQEIRTSINQEMLAAIQNKDLSNERFQMILQAVQQDPELMQRLERFRDK